MCCNNIITGECSFEYLAQPPSTTLPEGCNPYDQNKIIHTLLECTVRSQSSVFEIKWFRKNTIGEVEDLGLGDYQPSYGDDLTS